MVSGGKIRARYRLTRALTSAVMLGVSAAFIFGLSEYRKRQVELQFTQKASETLAVQTEILAGVLEKYRLLPPLLSRQNDISGLFSDELFWPERHARARIKAEEVAGLSGAREVSFFWPNGSQLASARGIYQSGEGGAKQLIEAAYQGRLGRLAVSMNTANRAYGFSAGVRRDGKFLGVAVVYVGFESIEATWSLSTNPIIVTDNTNTIILTNRPAWRLKNISDLLGGKEAKYINLERNLPLLQWRLHVLVDPSAARASGVLAGGTAALISVLIGAALLMLLSRQETRDVQLRRDKALALRLERIVRDRTRALSLTNASLSHEIEERKQAEARLRLAQNELIQTAKLAVLGQMAATLSHEMNQPLAAMRTYADNARRFLELGRPADVSSTLSRVSAMVDRMAELSGALLSFSRKPGSEMRAVTLASVLDEALILVSPRAKNAGVKLIAAPNMGELTVYGGRIRLSQVLVNLINNAVDALSVRTGGQIEVSAKRQGDTVVITVSDNGPGIPEELRNSIFDPFFTTKPPGEGIGVGLSIVYNIVQDFGGSIRLTDLEKPGCTFEIRLQAADEV